jgi:predicted nucleic acid-binding protein
MAHLVDTGLLLRLANTGDVLYPVAANAVKELHRQGEVLRLAPQNLIEFRGSATRSVEVNGLGLSAAEAETQTVEFEATFPLLPETPDIYPAWKALVQAAGVVGKQVHDARLVAICQVHGITHILTFNVRHFARLATFAPGVTVVDPHGI